MNRCPITYESCEKYKYSKKALHLLSPLLNRDPVLPFSSSEQLDLAMKCSNKLSIAGVQPKLSLRLNATKHLFEVVENGGNYILKPQHPTYPELPENEDLTMRLAKVVGIEIPFHGLIYGSDGCLSYLIRRFDRYGHGKKYAVEDFSQLSQHTRDTKYESSMEKLIPVIEECCSFPHLECLKLFRLTLFCFLVGNEDMHLKNFSLIRRPNKVELAPAYDLLNSTLVMGENEEFALPIAEKRRKLNRRLLCDYYGKERLKLNQKVIDRILSSLKQAYKEWKTLIGYSFLSLQSKEKYLDLIDKRYARLFSE